MNKITQLVFGILVVILLTIIVIGIYKNKDNLGNIFVNENAYSSAPTYASSTLTNNVASSLVPRATSSRTYAQICHREDSANNVPIKIFKQTTSTGVITGLGHPIYSSSTSAGSTCFRVDENDSYTGQIWGISSATTTATIEYLQN